MNYRNLTLLCVLTTLVALAGCEPKPQAPKATAISSQAALA